MTYNWVKDISDMHDKFGVKAWFEENKGDRELMQKYLAFRLAMCQEEMTETFDAMKDKDTDQ